MSEYSKRIAIGVALAVIIGIALVSVVSYPPPGRSSATSRLTMNSIACASSFANGVSPPFSSATSIQKEGSHANLCLRFFYYNSTDELTVNAQNEFTIFKPVFSPNSNCISQCSGLDNVTGSLFSIYSTTDQFQIGGPNAQNEGIPVNYTIFQKSNTPGGTYEIGINAALYPAMIGCGLGIYMTLQVGNTTNPTVGTSCFVLENHSSNVPGFVNGSLYTEIVGISNSTA